MSSWRRLSNGDRDKVVLAIDFDSTVRPEARFDRLAGLLEPAREVWLTAQPDAAEREPLPPEAYLTFWGDRPAGRVDTVMGYCVGCVFAPALADVIALDQGERPALLLVDPEPVVTASLHRDFEKAVGGMTVLTETERATAVAEARTLCLTAGDDFAAAAAGVVKLYATTAGAAFERLGVDEETSEDLLGLFRSYVSYLSAGFALEPERGWASAVALTSSLSSPGARYAASAQRFPIGSEDMLSDRRVADAVRLFLEKR